MPAREDPTRPVADRRESPVMERVEMTMMIPRAGITDHVRYGAPPPQTSPATMAKSMTKFRSERMAPAFAMIRPFSNTPHYTALCPSLKQETMRAETYGIFRVFVLRWNDTIPEDRFSAEVGPERKTKMKGKRLVVPKCKGTG